MSEHPQPIELTFAELTAETWADFEALFEARGGPKNCWRMVWRPMPTGVRKAGRAARKLAMQRYVEAGTPVGLLGYHESVPVAWCSIAPRASYRAGLAEAREGDADERVWSLVCFYVHRPAAAAIGEALTRR